MNISFVLMGDEKYFLSIAVSVLKLSKLYPDSSVGVYDWGFSASQRDFLTSIDSVVLIDWRDKFIKDPYCDTFNKKIERFFFRGLRSFKIELKSIFFGEHPELKKEWILAQKPYCFKDWASRDNVENFVFLDGDAVLVKKIDEVVNSSMEIGVTLRRPHEVSLRISDCQAINSGVVIFNGETDKNVHFIESWIKQMKSTNEYLVEQTALSRLLFASDHKIFRGFYDSRPISINDVEYKVSVLDCETYNYNWIEEGVKEKTKVLHFKGGRHQEANFIALGKENGLEEEIRCALKI